MPSEYSIFVSSYNTSNNTLGSTYKKFSFDEYAKLLDDEEKKLISMKILTSPKSKALVANNEGSSNSASQSSNKGKGKNQKWKKNKSEDAEKTTPSSNQQGKYSLNSNKKWDNNKESSKMFSMFPT